MLALMVRLLTVVLVGDEAGGGRMAIEKLWKMPGFITENMDVVGFTAAEYLPFDKYRL